MVNSVRTIPGGGPVENVPAELRDRPQWVAWRRVLKDNKARKVPIDPATGRAANCNDPATWGSFDAALAFAESDNCDGVSYALSESDPYSGLDLDDAIDPASNEIDADAVATIDRFASYTELSPSQLGIHILIRATLTGLVGRKRGDRECYDRARFLTVTGLRSSPHEICERQAELNCWHAEIWPPVASAAPRPPSRPLDLSDAQILDRVKRSKQAAKFERLWAGDTDGYASGSEADLALCSMLSFWCGGDPAAVDRLFRCSALMRPKWDSRRGASSYGIATVAKAVAGGASYDPAFRSAPGAPVATWRTTSSPAAVPPGGPPPVPPTVAPAPASGAVIILEYFRTRYRPDFRRGNAVHSADGQTVPMGVACAVPDSALIEKLAAATDAPRTRLGDVNRNGLPGFFKTWAKVAWGDLLASLPDEDVAALAPDTLAGTEFRRLVREAMLAEVVLGDTIAKSSVTQTERRALIDWCEKWAKPGPWRSIRSKRCWCKSLVLCGGEIRLQVAIRHELFSQVRADPRLCEMGANTFGRRAVQYGVGSVARNDRPHGLSAVVLSDEFVSELMASINTDEGAETVTQDIDQL